jgi:exodeoxyribonuclease-5
MNLSPQQAQAYDAVGAWLKDPGQQVFYLAGYAGTGKTTIAKGLAGQLDGDSAFMAFTGKAASVLTKKGCPASTIHSSIYKLQRPDEVRLREIKEELKKGPNEALSKEFQEKSRPKFVLNKEESFVKDLDLVIVDEVSMVDEALALDLLSFGKKILVLGDPGQLPPVGGEGYFTKGKPDFLLTEIHRQAAGSPIITMATQVRQGQRLAYGKRGDSEVIRKYKADYMAPWDQIIVGRNLTRQQVNEKLRLGSPAVPEKGEKLICLRNNAELGLLNGTQWIVADVADRGRFLELSLVDTDRQDIEPLPISAHPLDANLRDMMPYERRAFNEFDYGYGITCHKSQGSQWNNVLVVNEGYCFREDAAKWLYTAITRAAETVTIAM